MFKLAPHCFLYNILRYGISGQCAVPRCLGKRSLCECIAIHYMCTMITKVQVMHTVCLSGASLFEHK